MSRVRRPLKASAEAREGAQGNATDRLLGALAVFAQCMWWPPLTLKLAPVT